MKCAALTKAGQPCRAPGNSSGFCPSHDPAQRDRMRAANKLGGANSHRPPRVLADSLRLESVADVVTALGRTVNDVRAGRLEVKIANCVGYLCQQITAALQGAELERRVKELEELARRPQAPATMTDDDLARMLGGPYDGDAKTAG